MSDSEHTNGTGTHNFRCVYCRKEAVGSAVHIPETDELEGALVWLAAPPGWLTRQHARAMGYETIWVCSVPCAKGFDAG